MQERLIVKNFGPIKEVDLDLRQTTIFIGEQASGKSTLAKLIGIFRQPNLFDDQKTQVEIQQQLYNNTETIGLSNSFFNTETLIKYVSNELNIEIRGTKINIINNLWHNNRKQTIIQLIDNQYPEFAKIISEQRSGRAIYEKSSSFFIQLFKDNPDIISEVNQASQETPVALYIPAERILIPTIAKSLFHLIDTNTNLPKFITLFGNRFERARQTKKEYYADFLNISYSNNNNQDFILQNGIEFELIQASSGTQSIIPMLLVIEDFTNHRSKYLHFIIEEPELNLYPTTQHDLLKFIASKCTNRNQQLTITTHSPYTLSTLNVLLLAHQTGKVDEQATNQIIPKESWINPDDFNAYFVEKGGTIRQIFDRDAGMIAENELDDVSLSIGDEFDELMDIYRSVAA